MKTLLTIFILFFSSALVAEDISDFEIDEMSIGDSLLNYFSDEEIKLMNKLNYPKSNKFIKFDTNPIIIKSKLYDAYSFHIKENDNEKIIFAIGGIKMFGKNNSEKCMKFQKEVTKDLISTLDNIKQNSYEFKYENLDDGKSIAYVTDFDLENGSVRIWCVNWSKITENKRNFEDNVTIEISSKKFNDWLNTESQ